MGLCRRITLPEDILAVATVSTSYRALGDLMLDKSRFVMSLT
jgi:hypothetical protein